MRASSRLHRTARRRAVPPQADDRRTVLAQDTPPVDEKAVYGTAVSVHVDDAPDVQ